MRAEGMSGAYPQLQDGPAQMRAVVLREYGPPETLRVERVAVPRPRADEALLRVRAVSVDRFQMELRSGRALDAALPRIMGNGPAGEIAALGQNVAGLQHGQRVVVCNNVSCGACRYCMSGRETLCAGLNDHRGGMIGAHRDGGYAEYVAVPARNALPLPDAVTFEQACLLPNTIAPVVKACSGRARIRAGESVLVVGAGGGMGLHAVQAARLCGARVIAALRSPARRDALRAAGADVVLCSGEDIAAESHRRTNGWGVDAVLDFVATRETLAASLGSLAPGGRLVIMGYFPRGSTLETPTWVFTEEIEVTGNRSAGRRDVAEAITLVANGRIRPVIDRVLPLEEAVAAHRAFEAGDVTGRIVLTA